MVVQSVLSMRQMALDGAEVAKAYAEDEEVEEEAIAVIQTLSGKVNEDKGLEVFTKDCEKASEDGGMLKLVSLSVANLLKARDYEIQKNKKKLM